MSLRKDPDKDPEARGSRSEELRTGATCSMRQSRGTRSSQKASGIRRRYRRRNLGTDRAAHPHKRLTDGANKGSRTSMRGHLMFSKSMSYFLDGVSSSIFISSKSKGTCRRRAAQVNAAQCNSIQVHAVSTNNRRGSKQIGVSAS